MTFLLPWKLRGLGHPLERWLRPLNGFLFELHVLYKGMGRPRPDVHPVGDPI